MFDDRKIIYTNNKLSIFSYNDLKELSNEKIIIDFYEIIGTNLRIQEMDDYLIVVSGKIGEIKFNEEV